MEKKKKKGFHQSDGLSCAPVVNDFDIRKKERKEWTRGIKKKNCQIENGSDVFVIDLRKKKKRKKKKKSACTGCARLQL